MENNSSALLIIDAQVGLVELMSAEVKSSALPKIKTLLTEARASGIPVIYIQHDGAEGHPLEAQQRAGNFIPRSNQRMASASLESENRTRSSEPLSNRNLKKEESTISSLREP